MAETPRGGREHAWTFRARFRKGAFGWRSGPAVTRVREAVREIRKAARKDPLLGAEGAVLFMERVSPALERVDSSSGAIGNAVNRRALPRAAMLHHDVGMKMSRTQLSFDREMLRRARTRAGELGVSLAEYVRRLVARDLGERAPPSDVSQVFDLGRSLGSDIAGDKDAMLAEAFTRETP